MEMIVMVLIAAVLVEALVEYGKQIVCGFASDEWHAAVLQLCAIVVAVLLCLLLGADMFEAIGIPIAVPHVGTVLTGVFVSRGSNYISDLISKLHKTAKKE